MDKAARKPARRRIAALWWKRILWRFILALFILIIIIAIAGFVLYLNRNAAYETLAKRVLKERGYDVSLTVESATTERAIIKNIVLSKAGTQFAAVKSLEAHYDWEEIFDGQLRGVTLTGLSMDIAFDESGSVISDWLPAPSGKPMSLPSDGIAIKDSVVDVSSPYGALDLRGNVNMTGLQNLTADVKFNSNRLEIRGYAAAVSGAVKAVRTGEQVELQSAAFNLGDITAPDGPLANADLTASGILTLPGEGDIVTYSGRAHIDARDFAGPFFDSRHSLISFDGLAGYDMQSRKFLPSKFELLAELKSLSLRDALRRKDLARRLTLKETLQKTPVAGVFIDDITIDIESLLRGADWTARAKVDYNRSGYTVDLTAPLSVKNARSSVIIKPSASGAEFAYDKAGAKLELSSDIALKGRRDLGLDDFSVRGLTDNGYLWTQIDTVGGRAKTVETWTEQSVRLAPFDAAITYHGGTASTLSIEAALDYDGPLLGNDFTGLVASGRLTLNRKKAGFDLGFETQQSISAKTVVTPFGYIASNLSMYLNESAPLLKRRGDVDTITLNTRDLKSAVASDDGREQYSLTARQANITGMRGDAGERYEVQTQDLTVTSETTPGPNSRLATPQLTVMLSRDKDTPLTYEIQSPSIDAKAGAATLTGVAVTLNGGPGATDFTYDGGTVLLAGTNLPALPVSGHGRLEDGRFTGSAKTALPRAPRFPIYADYVYEGGEGQAQLDIPKFVFSPGGVQPQDLAPALRGKIAAVEGVASARATLGYKPGQPITSEGTISIASMDIGTLVGPLSGVAADLEFSSLYPLRSSGRQTVMMEGFDPGIPLGTGTVTFTVVKDGFDLIDASWPMGSGEISVKPTFWSTAGAVNNVTVMVRDISLGDLITRFGNENLSATGLINGTLPVVIDGVNLRVQGGNLAIKDGGVISVKTKQLDAAGDNNDVAKLAVDALKNFEYDELSLELNGPLDGEMKLGAVFTGSNPKVLGGAEFLFRTTIEGELANIARNLASATQMQNIKKSVAQKVEAEKAKSAGK